MKSGRDEPVWVVIHICMGTTQGLSLYSYLYLKLTKMPCFSHYLLCFFSTKLENKMTEQVVEFFWISMIEHPVYRSLCIVYRKSEMLFKC
jgi:hypothetical protein